ncbi:hypothetical protein MGSAQ_001350, partial [marine sediment metagenome]
RQGTEYTYQAFKEAMVDHAARYGIQLEATTRLQRGHINYPPTGWRVAAGKGKGCDDRHCLRGPFGQASDR